MPKLFIDKKSLLIVVAAGIFLVSLVLSMWILRPSDKRLVEVVSNGKVLYTYDLSNAEDTEFTVTYNGSSNTVRIEGGEIWVREAECPDQTCVEMGKLRWENLPIVCLPNRLTIQFAE